MAAVGWRISGRVQGVWFRAGAREQALRLGLTGSAVNCPDGTVEVHAEGESDALDALERWLWQGPPAAQVIAVERLPGRSLHGSGFVIG